MTEKIQPNRNLLQPFESSYYRDPITAEYLYQIGLIDPISKKVTTFLIHNSEHGLDIYHKHVFIAEPQENGTIKLTLHDNELPLPEVDEPRGNYSFSVLFKPKLQLFKLVECTLAQKQRAERGNASLTQTCMEDLGETITRSEMYVRTGVAVKAQGDAQTRAQILQQFRTRKI